MELWNKCSQKLENSLTQEDFNTWIRPLKATIDNNTLELVAPNEFILDYIEKNFSKEIQDPYRWLEDDLDKETKSWIEDQNLFTDKYFEKSDSKEQTLITSAYLFSFISLPNIILLVKVSA